jgi:uncharacterized ferredoxin-like protein
LENEDERRETPMTMIKGETAETEGVLTLAKAMAVAARTAPKARGVDAIETLIIAGEELDKLARAMEDHGVDKGELGDAFKRDAASVRKSHAVLLIGLRDLRPKKADKPLDCGGCGHGNCAGFLRADQVEGNDFPGPVCMFQSLDLGIALASACAVAARFHVDNRMMYTNGGPARKLGWMESQVIFGIPLSCTGKNIYFDREG